MFRAEKTVKNYVSTLSGKLGLKQRTAAAAYAARILAASKLQIEPGHDDHRPEALNLLKLSEP